MKYVARLFPVGLFSLTALVACADPLEAPTAALRSERALDARGVLRDAEIDRSDTHFGARVVTTTTRHDGEAQLSAGDPMITAGEDEVYLEGGYGADGRMRFSVYFESPSESPRIGFMRMVGNELQTFDRRGALLRSQLSDDAMAAAGLPSGDHALAYFVFEPPTCPAGASECTVAAASLQADALAEGAAVQATDVRVIRIRPRTARSGGPSDVAEVEQRYRRVRRGSALEPEAWRLEEIHRTQREEVDGRARVTTVVTRLSYRVWDRNAAQEQGRARRRAARAAESPRVAPRSPTVMTPSVHSATESMLSRRTSMDANLAAEPRLLGDVCRQGTAEFDRVRPAMAGGLNVLYQHGFCSDANVFFSFDERLAQSMAVARSRAFSLASTARIEDQVVALRNRMVSKTTDRPFLIGHSQGGLVARRLGQLSPERISGVMTIGTPHLGSILAGIGPELAEEYLNRIIRNDCFTDVICGWVDDIITDFTSGLLLFGRDVGAPVLHDLAPRSPFLQTLNSTHESFPRVSVEVSAGRRWALARMVGDSRSSQERLLRGTRPLGDARVMQVDDLYRTTKFLHYFSAMSIFTTWIYSRGISCDRLGYASFWPSCTNPAWDFNTQWGTTLLLYLTYDVTGRIMAIMDGIDRTWDEMTTARVDETDGLIHLTSQRYPAVPGTYLPQRVAVNPLLADSHLGQMKSPAVFLTVLENLSRLQGRSR